MPPFSLVSARLCDNGGGPDQCGNTDQGLTTQLKPVRRRAAMAEPERTQPLWLVGTGITKDPRFRPPKLGRERTPLPDGLRRSVLRRDGYACRQCPARWSPGEDLYLQVDHIFPAVAGGTDRTDNLRTLCEQCNWDKLDHYTVDAANARARLIVANCYWCGPRSDDVCTNAAVYCATCRRITYMDSADADERELARWLGRV
jgi:hypothetical protein